MEMSEASHTETMAVRYPRSPVPIVVMQHLEGVAQLHRVRSLLVRAPHVRILTLGRTDERIAAHLDGMEVAGEYGSSLCLARLGDAGSGEVFAATVGALHVRDAAVLARLLAIAQSLPQSQEGLIAAFGWVSASSLRGITKVLLEAPDAFHRQVGLAACGMHRVDPGSVGAAALTDADAGLRARAFRVMAERGRVELMPACRSAMADGDDRCAFEAARAAVLLGDRDAAVAALDSIASAPGRWRQQSLELILKLHSATRARALLKPLSQDPADLRLLIRGVGVAGDPHFVPWLLQQMHGQAVARLAGEAFSLVTGLDLASLGLDRKPPGDVEFGPNDDPADGNVAMDEDEGLPWPDPEKIAGWWQAEGHRFAPGTRYFMGQPLSPSHCLAVLRNGFQRQRMAAALYLCLMNPGTPLFNTAAPAWRQQRWLAAMGA